MNYCASASFFFLVKARQKVTIEGQVEPFGDQAITLPPGASQSAAVSLSVVAIAAIQPI
jgi:hypothetical protein